MNKLSLNLDDLSVDTFQAGPVSAAQGTVHGQALTKNCPTKNCDGFTDDPDICIVTNDTGCNVFTDDEPGCPIVVTGDDPACAGL
jgi:hypothetical protein